MLISNYLKMNYDELSKEIEKQNRKIKAAQETIKLLKKLQVAETVNASHKGTENVRTSVKENSKSAHLQETRFYEGGTK